MAFQRDYVLRMIEMMGEFFRRLCTLKTDKDKLRMLDDICRDQCGLSLKAAHALTPESLCRLLPAQGVMMLSEISFLRIQLEKDEEKQMEIKLLTLRLLSALYEEDVLCTERGERLRSLMDDCAAQLSSDDYMACARFFLAGEYYAHGEDALFLAVEEAPSPADYILQGIALFTPLLSLPENALLLGGMSREDVSNAINDLETWESA